MAQIDVSHNADCVLIMIGNADAERLQGELSDLLCWLRGYQAGAKKSAAQFSPMGIEGAREINIALKHALSRSPK